MQRRLASKTLRGVRPVGSSIISKPPLHLLVDNISANRRYTDHRFAYCPSRFFSVATPAGDDDDLSNLSHRELEQLALKYARQTDPRKAQLVLASLQQTKASDEEVAIIWSSVIDAWLEYQKEQMQLLIKSVQQEDTSATLLGHVENIHSAAKAASEMVEGALQVDRNQKKVSSHHLVAVLRTWANASEAIRLSGFSTKNGPWSGIPQRSQHLLDNFFKDKVPPTEAVNQVLKAWACSSEYMRGTMAELCFQKHLQGSTVTPDWESYRAIIRAWSWSKESRAAFTATGHLMRMMRLLDIGRVDLEPSLEDYHILFQAWTSADDKNAPSKVHAVLQLADDAYRKGLTDVRPDIQCYSCALQTMARRVNVPQVGELVDQTLSEMKRERMLIPNTACYGAAILAWKNVATGRECDDREAAVDRCYELLKEMIAAFHRTTIVEVTPSTEHYNHVLEVLTISKSQRSLRRAQSLLSEMEASAEPNAESYRFVITTWGNSKSPEKVEEARELLARFISRLSHIRSISQESSIVDTMSAFITVCAKENSISSEAAKMEKMILALRTLELMKDIDLVPNSTCYAALIEACGSLVQNGQDRQRLLENIFTRASDEGHVDQSVLEKFKAAASSYLYAKMVVARSQEVENMKVVPESWTRNVKGFLANSKGGRKVLPLTIDGQFTFTKAATEYKMRKLRRQSNKKMLQGGRQKR